MATSKKRIHQMTIAEWERAFPDEDACDAYLVRHRWPTGVVCPRCGNPSPKSHGTMRWNWLCNQCGQPTNYRFSDITGTIFENTNKPLRDWFRVIHKMLVSKKGISALQIYREMGFGSYKTAWYMCHRVRTALQDKDFQRMMGIVEIDETFIGGKKGNRHVGQRGMKSEGPKGGSGGKAIVMGAASRTKKTVVARVVDNVSRATVRQFVAQMCEPKISIIATDEYPSYKSLSEDLYPRASVDHKAGQYVHYDHVAGVIHTNTIEGFWSILKRGIIGTYHKVSPKYLPLYVAEFQFRYNNRSNEDIFGEAMKGC
jgi:IS1 family transposase/transposase-like protein